MLRGEGDGAVAPLEIVQTRDLTLGEATSVTKAVTRAYVRGLGRDPWYWVALLLYFGSFVVISGVAMSLSRAMRCCDPRLFWWVVAATALFFAGMVAYQGRCLRFIAIANQSAIPAGTRHTLDAAGYTIEHSGQITFIPWRRIIAVERGPHQTMVATSRVHFWPIVATSCANQDVEGFVAELERRWKRGYGGDTHAAG